MNCKKCNFKNETGSIFCESCGEKMSKESFENTSEPAILNEKKAIPKHNGDSIVCTSCDNKNPSDSNFCENCGLPLSGPEIPARLVSSDGSIMKIMSEKNVYGRQDFVKWVPEEYNDPRISREHIRIDYENKTYFLSLAKAQVNVTKLNGGVIAGNERYELKNQDEIDIALGRLIMTFEMDVDNSADQKEIEKLPKKEKNDGKVKSNE